MYKFYIVIRVFSERVGFKKNYICILVVLCSVCDIYIFIYIYVYIDYKIFGIIFVNLIFRDK